jgi:putative membrane protein
MPFFLWLQSGRSRRTTGRSTAEEVMKRILYLVVIAITLLFGITFALQNRQTVEVGYYFGLAWSGPLSIALLAVLALGVAIGYLAGLRMVIRMQRSLVQARKDLRQVEQEVQNLRALPIKDVI